MWEILKKQLIEKIINEIKCKNNWNTIDEFIIIPIISKFNNHLNRYLYFFLTINVLIMILIITNIFITIYYHK